MSMTQGGDWARYFQRLSALKKLFWLYFILLIFEGALRKWVLPQLSAPLLVVRDPVSFLIIWEAYRTHKWPAKWSVLTGILVSGLIMLAIIQVVAGDNPWFVALYGLRSYVLPFPVMFAMGENLDYEDLRRFGLVTLWLLLPMTVLQIAQYRGAPTDFVNAGATRGGGQIGYVQGHVRAAGTFSFVVGSINYGALAAAFIFYGLVNERFAKKWLLWAASFALILSVPVIGARTLVFELGGVFACVGVGAFLGVSQFSKSLRIIVPVLIVAFLVTLLPIFSQASQSLTMRFNQADISEGGAESSLVSRSVGSFTYADEQADLTDNLLGVGMGRGAAAISTLLTGSAQFLAGETEASREITELGPIFGIAFQLFRWFLAIYVFGHALSQARDHRPLALLLIPMAVSCLLLSVMEQPTEQGFMVIGMAFVLAALKASQQTRRVARAQQHLPGPMRYRARLQRG